MAVMDSTMVRGESCERIRVGLSSWIGSLGRLDRGEQLHSR